MKTAKRKTNPIKGLLLHSFYSARTTIMILFCFSLLFGIFLCLAIHFGAIHAHVAPVFALLGISAFSCSLMAGEYKEIAVKWNKFQLAMPIKRSDAIASKYLGHLLMLLAGIIFTGIYIGLIFVLQEGCRECFVEKIFMSVPASIGTSLVSCALFHFIACVAGMDKEGALWVVCMFVSGGINGLILWTGYVANVQFIGAAACILVSAALYAVFYVVTKKIYAKKDL